MLLLIWLRRWKNHWRLLSVFGLFGFFFLFVGGPVVMPRYQIPALPVLCVLAALFMLPERREGAEKGKKE